MGVPKINDHIQSEKKMPNANQEPPASYKVPNQDLMDIHVSSTFKIKIERSKFGIWVYQRPNQNQDPDAKPQSATPSILQSNKLRSIRTWMF